MKNKNKVEVVLTREQFITRTIDKAEAKKLAELKKNQVQMLCL